MKNTEFVFEQTKRNLMKRRHEGSCHKLICPFTLDSSPYSLIIFNNFFQYIDIVCSYPLLE